MLLPEYIEHLRKRVIRAKHRGLRYRDMAYAAGMNAFTLQRFREGGQPTLDTLIRVESYLNRLDDALKHTDAAALGIRPTP